MKRIIDIKLLKVLTVFYSIITLLSFGKKAYLKINGYGYEIDSWSELLSDGLIDWLIVMIFMSLIAISAKLMIERQVKWSYIITVHLFFALFFGIILYFLSSIVYLITGQISLAEIDIQSHFAGIISVIDLNFLIYFSMISIVYTFYYFQKKREAEIERSILESQLTKTQMNILKYKIHPHFLFNTLNSISSLIETDKKMAQDTVADFGDLLRDLLNISDDNLITIQDELTICKRYLDIMSLRFSDHLKVGIHVDKELEFALVPSLLLLPIIENSIKHGYSYDVTSLSLELSITRKKKLVYISISNDGAPLKEKKISFGHGLENTVDRLQLLFKKKYTFSMQNNKNGKGINTTITLPFQYANS